jgi:cytochrome P450
MAPRWVPTRQNREFNQAQGLLDRVVLNLIEARRSRTQGNGDVLDLLLAARDEETGACMSDQQLKDEVVTLLTAGHETVGAGLAWSWHLLTAHPQVQQALHDEAKGRLKGALPTAADLPHLPLATAVFEEAMRLYPPAWGMPRESIAEDEICGLPLPAKSTLILSQWLIHRHPEYWTEADQFRPERFLPANAAACPRQAYFPFGGGPRVCIGNSFAMVEGPLVLAGLAQHFEFIARPGFEPILDATFTLRPKTGVPATIRSRS